MHVLQQAQNIQIKYRMIQNQISTHLGNSDEVILSCSSQCDHHSHCWATLVGVKQFSRFNMIDLSQDDGHSFRSLVCRDLLCISTRNSCYGLVIIQASQDRLIPFFKTTRRWSPERNEMSGIHDQPKKTTIPWEFPLQPYKTYQAFFVRWEIILA